MSVVQAMVSVGDEGVLNARKLYRGMELTATTLVRLTRDAEVEMADDSNTAVSEVVKEQIR